jgi:hypothetical protein
MKGETDMRRDQICEIQEVLKDVLSFKSVYYFRMSHQDERFSYDTIDNP